MPATLNDTDLHLLYPQNALAQAEQLGIERYIPQKTRDSYADEDFAGPDRSFPITSQAQLDAAAHLIGHADNPEAVKKKAIAIAKRKGFTLPDAWKEDDKDDSSDRAATADTPILPEDAPENTERTAFPDTALLYAPIVRYDKQKREVEGVATSEAVDTFGTIFSYDASKKAFQKWIERTANVREMHQKKAVGKGIGVRFDDAEKKIYVITRVSRSADGDNTWTKIEEGIINGFSVGADGRSAVWDTVTRDGKSYPRLISYDLAELSLVDNASNPDAHGLLIARADGLTDLVDTTDDTPSIPVASSSAGVSVSSPLLSSTVGAVERVGARVGAGTRSAMHESIGHTLQAAKSQMKNCGCEQCSAALKQIDPDDDGDIDAFGGAYGDDDNDADALMADAERMATQRERDALQTMIERTIQAMLSPTVARSNAVLSRISSLPDYPEYSPELIRSAVSAEISAHLQPATAELASLKETVNTALERIERASSQPEVRAELSAVKEVVERIAAQPQSGGPVLNGGYPVDKRLANQPYAQPTQQDPRAFWDEAMRQGLLTTPELQMRAAAAAVVPMQNRKG
jgi:hypothetical protein